MLPWISSCFFFTQYTSVCVYCDLIISDTHTEILELFLMAAAKKIIIIKTILIPALNLIKNMYICSEIFCLKYPKVIKKDQIGWKSKNVAQKTRKIKLTSNKRENSIKYIHGVHLKYCTVKYLIQRYFLIAMCLTPKKY